MKLTPITEVCKEFDVSTRTLRYYEQIGLIQSDVKENYAYRAYNGQQIEKLKQVLLLRKLRIPLKQIMGLFENADMGRILDVLAESMRETEDEINYLSNIKNALNLLTQKLKSNNINVFDDSDVLKTIDILSPSKKLNTNKKTNAKKTDIPLPYFSKLKNSEVRIITLPPATVASYCFEGDGAEEKAAAVIDDFVRKNDLAKIKPGLRRYGFSIDNPTSEPKKQGYEMRVTIPDDFYVAPPLEKKRFEGGLYASYTIPFGEFEGWFLLYDWVANSDKYASDYKDGNENLHELEELINYSFHITMPQGSVDDDMQLDLLMPIRIIENNENGETSLKSIINIKCKTLSQLEEEARQGDPIAQCDFAYCFFKGYHTAINYKKAVEWYQKSAKQGYARAQCTLGYCYKKGLGLPKNEEKAAELFEKAAVQNSPAAMLNLAWAHMGGAGVDRDYPKALFWFEKAAEQNDNPRIKHRANHILNDLRGLINRKDIKLEFHQPEDLQTIKKKEEGEQRTIISVVYTNFDC